MTTVRLRYMIIDLDPAVTFYTKYLGFHVKFQARPNFAMLSLGNLELVLSTTFGPGGAAQPMLDGSKAEPGGWNRLIIYVDDIAKEVARLRDVGAHFRNDITKGIGGLGTLLEDPSGNAIELFQPFTMPSADDEAAIRTLEDRFAEAFNSGDVDTIMRNYIPDKTLVVFDVVPRKQYFGADTYRANWVDFFTKFTGIPKIAITNLGIVVDGNLGFSHSIQHVTGKDLQDHSVDRKVRVTDGYRKIDGNWLIVLEHVSLPVDLKTGSAVFSLSSNTAI